MSCSPLVAARKEQKSKRAKRRPSLSLHHSLPPSLQPVFCCQGLLGVGRSLLRVDDDRALVAGEFIGTLTDQQFSRNL